MYRYELSMTNPLESKSAGVGGWVTCSGSLGLPPSSSSVVVGVRWVCPNLESRVILVSCNQNQGFLSGQEFGRGMENYYPPKYECIPQI